MSINKLNAILSVKLVSNSILKINLMIKINNLN